MIQRKSDDQLEKRKSRDNTRAETVLLIAPEKPNVETLAAMVLEWVAPRLAEEFLREHQQFLPKEDHCEQQPSLTKP